MAANNCAAPTVLRLNLVRGRAEELLAVIRADEIVVAERGRLPETVLVEGAPRLDGPAYRTGLFAVQGEASQLVARLLAPAPGATVVDCAAAPGGKSAHLTELVGPAGRVLALDLRLAGLRQARAIANRLGHRNIHWVRGDAAGALPLRPAAFHHVLLDAPCTGLGTLRQHPEIRWRLRPADLPRMAALQGRMLEQAAGLVAPGGCIVYSVCSVAPDEGELVVRGFLERTRGFVVDRATREAAIAELIEADGFMRTRPDRGGLDGFFAARLKRLR